MVSVNVRTPIRGLLLFAGGLGRPAGVTGEMPASTRMTCVCPFRITTPGRDMPGFMSDTSCRMCLTSVTEASPVSPVCPHWLSPHVRARPVCIDRYYEDSQFHLVILLEHRVQILNPQSEPSTHDLPILDKLAEDAFGYIYRYCKPQTYRTRR